VEDEGQFARPSLSLNRPTLKVGQFPIQPLRGTPEWRPGFKSTILSYFSVQRLGAQCPCHFLGSMPKG